MALVVVGLSNCVSPCVLLTESQTYLPLFLPPPVVPGASKGATGTEAAPAVPPS